MKNATRPAIFKWRQTAPELILCAVRWYLRYSLSLRAGIQLESPILSSTKLQLLGEYYDGNSPNGQFFERRTKFAGFGVHMYF